MITYLQVKAERTFITTALMIGWGLGVVAQGVVLVSYPLYRTVIHRRGPDPLSPPAE